MGNRKLPMPDLDELRRFLYYDPVAGVFVWKRVTGNRVRVGDIVKKVERDGYINVTFMGRRYSVSRLAYFYMTGKEPPDFVDHENRIKSDNRFKNLRDATNQENIFNCSRHQDNRTGFKGVHLHKETGKFRAQICKNGKKRHIGLFDTAELAHDAYVSAAKDYFGEYHTGG